MTQYAKKEVLVLMRDFRKIHIGSRQDRQGEQLVKSQNDLLYGSKVVHEN